MMKSGGRDNLTIVKVASLSPSFCSSFIQFSFICSCIYLFINHPLKYNGKNGTSPLSPLIS